MSLSLDHHLKQKLANQSWLFDCVHGSEKAFPYRPKGQAEALMGRIYTPKNPSNQMVEPLKKACPQFVVNIPMGMLPFKKQGYQAITCIQKALRSQAYSTSAPLSARMGKRRLAVVIGINQIDSIDPELNRHFRFFIRRLPKIEGLVCRVFGFKWKPNWYQSADGNLYSLKKAFLLLKVLSKERAESVRLKFEMPKSLHPDILSQLSMQRIREVVKNSQYTRMFVQHAVKVAPSSPIYFTMMDADFLSLRTFGEGLFTQIEEKILSKGNFSVISPGYQVAKQELPLIKLAVRLDMAVRAAIIKAVSYGVYFPEPLTAVLVKRPGEKSFFRHLTFLGDGKMLESRRLIQSGRLKKHLDDKSCIFAKGGIVTTTPARMKTKKNRSLSTLTKAQIKQKRCLQALRGLPQSHIHPKQWADNLYVGIDFSCARVTDCTTPMMYIFSVYDPISRMFSASGKYSARVFDGVITNYDEPLSSGQKNLLKTARVRLLKLGMKKEVVDQIERAAKLSGIAMRDVLMKFQP